MSKSDTFENDMLKLVLQGVAIANIADNAATSPLTQLFLSLHAADPGEAGTESTNEIAYTGYARAPVARSAGGWTVTGNSAALAANIDFGPCTVGSATATHFAVGVAVSGATKVLYKGPISPTIAVAPGVTPRLTTGTAITED